MIEYNGNISTIMVVIGIVIFGFVAWLPTFFVKQGHSIVTSLTWSMIMSLGGPVGGLIGLTLVDRLGLYGFGSSASLAIQVALHLKCTVYVMTRDEKHQALARGAHPPEKLPRPR